MLVVSQETSFAKVPTTSKVCIFFRITQTEQRLIMDSHRGAMVVYTAPADDSELPRLLQPTLKLRLMIYDFVLEGSN